MNMKVRDPHLTLSHKNSLGCSNIFKVSNGGRGSIFTSCVLYLCACPFLRLNFPHIIFETVYGIEKAAKLNSKRCTAKIRLQTVL